MCGCAFLAFHTLFALPPARLVTSCLLHTLPFWTLSVSLEIKVKRSQWDSIWSRLWPRLTASSLSAILKLYCFPPLISVGFVFYPGDSRRVCKRRSSVKRTASWEQTRKYADIHGLEGNLQDWLNYYTVKQIILSDVYTYSPMVVSRMSI